MRTLMQQFLFTNSRENWFQYVRRVYATAINFPCISTLDPHHHRIQNRKNMRIDRENNNQHIQQKSF